MPRKKENKPEAYYDTFPTMLRKIMVEQGKTQQDVAEAIEKTRQAVGYYCDGSSSPDWKTLVRLAQHFGVSTDYLLGLSNVSSTKPEIKDVCKYTGLSERAVEKLSQDMFHREESSHLAPIMDYLISKSGLSFLAIHLWKRLVSDAVMQESLKEGERFKDMISDNSNFEKWRFISACEELYDYAKNDLSTVINIDARQELHSRLVRYIESATSTIQFAQAFVEECKREENK